MEQVKAACGCQYILNSWFYDTITGRPVGNLKIDGTVKAAAGWNGWGLTWDKGARHPPGHLTRQRRGFLPQRRGAADAHQGAGQGPQLLPGVPGAHGAAPPSCWPGRG